ncbi:hypothetical protein [Burkholderia territorii]|uniref:hypothetical protein n=1 Tax=Burkholderia territorii TaxID=1503055 RepID=UPI001E4C2B68|nr:hypothetical protein [Burkholderia territorii]
MDNFPELAWCVELSERTLGETNQQANYFAPSLNQGHAPTAGFQSSSSRRPRQRGRSNRCKERVAIGAEDTIEQSHEVELDFGVSILDLFAIYLHVSSINSLENFLTIMASLS